MSRTKLLQDQNGNASSARVIGMMVVINSILMVWVAIIFGFYHPEQFIAAMGTAAGLFTAMTTGTFIYLYNNKKKELDKLPQQIINPPIIPEQEATT